MTDANDTHRDRVNGVGVVGAGSVGQWFVENLVRADYRPVVYDVDDDAVDDAVERGAVAADHPADVADRSAVVLLALPSRAAVEAVMEGEDGILETLDDGLVVVDAGTTPPDVAVHYQEQCREDDAGYVDCGITWEGPGEYDDEERGPAFQVFVGGDPADYEAVRPVLDVVGYDHEFYEGIGTGHVVKAANRLRQTCRAAVAAEVVEFLRDNGIDPERVVDQLEWPVPRPFFDDEYSSVEGFERAACSDDDDTESRDWDVDDGGTRPRLAASEWTKDPASALSIARASNTHVPMLTAAYQTLLVAENYGSGLLDRELRFDDDQWSASADLTAVYRAHNRPQEEWRRLGRQAREEE